MTLPRRWPEHELIEREYPRKGRHWVAKRIGRSPDVVHAYARKHGLELGDMPGWIRVSELARLLGLEAPTVHQRAEAEGVIRRIRAATKTRGTIAAVVPQEWADAYSQEITSRLAGEELRDRAGWLSTPELVRLWKVGKSTILRGLNGQGVLADLLKDVRTARGMEGAKGGLWLVHPHDAERIRARLEADRAKAKTLVSTKSLAVECGVKQGYAATIGRDLGGELLFVHGRLMCHVTPQVAEAMRQRFLESKGPAPRPFKPRKGMGPKECEWCGEAFYRRTDPYESPGAFKQRKSCSPPCATRLSHARRAAARVIEGRRAA